MATAAPQSARERRFKKDEVILSEGSPATEEIFYLRLGTCTAEVRGRTVGRIEAGEFFGEVASILQSDRSATVRAATDCSVLVFQGLRDGSLLDLAAGDAAVIRKLFEQMALRLVESSRRHAGEAERLTALALRYRTALSGSLAALEWARGRHEIPFLEELHDFIRLGSGIAAGRAEDLDMRCFPRSKETTLSPGAVGTK